MEKFRWFVLLLLIAPFLASGQESATKIPWGTPLKWQDFKGKSDQSSSFFAVTSSGSRLHYSVKYVNRAPQLSYTVSTYFHTDKSWLKPGKEADWLLSHEQLHFDITELYARKLRRYLSTIEIKPKSSQREIKRLFHTINRKAKQLRGKRKQEQKRYDRETEHGMNSEKQAEWEKKIHLQLKKLEAFSVSV